MNLERAQALGSFLKDHRSALGLSTRALAARCGIDMATVVRLEQGAFIDPKPETLRAVADGLGISPSEVLILAGYVRPQDLPSFVFYLRARYPELPESAVEELERSFAEVARRHGLEVVARESGDGE
jgi:transcriptional regulator with XRE-family HTH domain